MQLWSLCLFGRAAIASRIDGFTARLAGYPWDACAMHDRDALVSVDCDEDLMYFALASDRATHVSVLEDTLKFDRDVLVSVDTAAEMEYCVALCGCIASARPSPWPRVPSCRPSC